MKRFVFAALFMLGIVGSVSAQHDDLYFIPKKKSAKLEHVKADSEQLSEQSTASQANTPVTNPVNGLLIDEDSYNRRGAYVTDSGVSVSEFAMDDDGFVVITEEGDTMFMNTDTLRLVREDEDEGWINGFEGSDSDYEYAMRIVRFRNPRYAIPVSSPLYWDVVYGGALWPIWDWNIYDDGMYAYVFPTSSNFYYWDYMMSYPFGWNPWHSHWSAHWNWHYGYHHYRYHWGVGFYGHTWCNPWYHPHYHGHHYGSYPGGIGHPGWSGPRAYRNDRKATVASTRRGTQDNNTAGRGSVSSSRRTSSELRTGAGATSTRSSSVRVVTGSSNRTSGTVRSSASRGASSASSVRGTSTGSNSRSSYTRQSSSRSGSSSSYNRPSSTRSSSSVSRSSSSSRSNSYSSSSRSSSYSSGSSYNNSSRSSSYSSGSSISNSSRSSGSFSGGSSRSSGGSSSRSSGGRR